MFHQWTQAAVADSTSSTERQDPCRWMSSALYRPLTDSARAVIAGALAPDRARGVDLGQALGVANREALGTRVRVMDQPAEVAVSTTPDRHLEGIEGELAYGADGAVTTATMPTTTALTTTSTYDTLGRLTARTTTPGPRAASTLTYNRAGKRLTEASSIPGDPANGTATTAYDPLDRLSPTACPASRPWVPASMPSPTARPSPPTARRSPPHSTPPTGPPVAATAMTPTAV